MKNRVMLHSKRVKRRGRKNHRVLRAPIVGMVSIDDRTDTVEDRRVPRNLEGDFIIGAQGAPAAATPSARTTLFTVILGWLDGKHAESLADSLIEYANALAGMMRKSMTGDQGSEMSNHAALTLPTDMTV